MATRKALALVSGLFQEINTPTDGIDFAGNNIDNGEVWAQHVAENCYR